MSLLDEFVAGKIALNNLDSDIEDIIELSQLIENVYPDLSKRTGFVYYPTLENFVIRDHDDCEICFYNKEYTIWDGYHLLEGSPFNNSFTADEILGKTVTDIDENDFMKIFL